MPAGARSGLHGRRATRRLTRGESHADVTRLLADSASLSRLAALALFDDADRGGDVPARLERDAGPALANAFRRCGETEEIAPSDAVDLVRLASQLTAWLRGLS